MSLSDTLQRISAQRAVKARVGIIETKTYPDGQTVAEVGFWNEYGTGIIPPRPFFRQAVANNVDALPAIIGRALNAGHDAETAVRMACEHMVDELKVSVITWEEPPNAPSTIAKKGYNAPLRGPDKLLRDSFSYEINGDD